MGGCSTLKVHNITATQALAHLFILPRLDFNFDIGLLNVKKYTEYLRNWTANMKTSENSPLPLPLPSSTAYLKYDPTPPLKKEPERGTGGSLWELQNRIAIHTNAGERFSPNTGHEV